MDGDDNWYGAKMFVWTEFILVLEHRFKKETN